MPQSRSQPQYQPLNYREKKGYFLLLLIHNRREIIRAIGEEMNTWLENKEQRQDYYEKDKFRSVLKDKKIMRK